MQFFFPKAEFTPFNRDLKSAFSYKCTPPPLRFETFEISASGYGPDLFMKTKYGKFSVQSDQSLHCPPKEALGP